MRALLSRFLTDDRGATAIEYGLIAALIALAVIACVTLLAGSLSDLWSSTAAKVTAAISG